MKTRLWIILPILLILLACDKKPTSSGDGFFSDDEIYSGGVPRDGIPALDFPPTLPAASAPWSDGEMIVGVSWPGGARAGWSRRSSRATR